MESIDGWNGKRVRKFKMKNITKYIIINYIIIGFIACSAFGTDPKGEHLKKIQSSPQYNMEEKIFVNRRSDLLSEMRNDLSYWKLINAYIFGKEERYPKEKLPEIKPNINIFLQKSDSISFIWFGHSTFMVNFGGKILLFDPIFSSNASPVSLFINRFQAPVLKLTELPNIDYIIISHDHYDHLDMETIKYFKNKSTKFIAPLGVTSHIKGWGIQEDRLSELDWWQSIEKDGLEFICTPAQHFSGRTGSNSNKTLWGSWIVRNKKNSLYFSGDSGYDIHFKQIGDKYGPFDLTFIENGQYNQMWRAVHVLPEETAQAFLDLKGKNLVPVHWGMFALSLHDWYEPIEELEKHSKLKNINLMTPKLGQLIVLTEENFIERWWKALINKIKQ